MAKRLHSSPLSIGSSEVGKMIRAAAVEVGGEEFTSKEKRLRTRIK
jgi:hypothetical protein